ncbi:hypothetical protein HK102_013280 [Quaeritorhiza haematococci]|nr:hypothetical protein HK102_013280 [Quaeritorhiza haematococci]
MRGRLTRRSETRKSRSQGQTSQSNLETEKQEQHHRTSLTEEHQNSLISSLEAPEILEDVVVGINVVTRALEKQHKQNAAGGKDIAENNHKIDVVFVCRGDAPGPQFYTHLPTLGRLAGDVIICPFGKGAEKALAQAMGLKKVLVLALKAVEVKPSLENALQGEILGI